MDLDALVGSIKIRKKVPTNTAEADPKKKPAPTEKTKKIVEKTSRKATDGLKTTEKGASSSSVSKKGDKQRNRSSSHAPSLPTNLESIPEKDERFPTVNPRVAEQSELQSAGDQLQPAGKASHLTSRNQKKDKEKVTDDNPPPKRVKTKISREQVDMAIEEVPDGPQDSNVEDFSEQDWRLSDFLSTIFTDQHSLRQPDIASYVCRNLILDGDLPKGNIYLPLLPFGGRLISCLPDFFESEAKRTTAIKQARLIRRKNEEDQRAFQEKVAEMETQIETLTTQLLKIKKQVEVDMLDFSEKEKNLIEERRSAETIANNAVKKENLAMAKLKEVEDHLKTVEIHSTEKDKKIAELEKKVSMFEEKAKLSVQESSQIINRFISGTQEYIERKIPDLPDDFFDDLPIEDMVKGKGETASGQNSDENEEEEQGGELPKN